MASVDQNTLSLETFSAILYHNHPYKPEVTAVEKVAASYDFLTRFSANKLIYGINTGFGPMAQYKVSDENLLQLQYNLIRSHSSGSGKLIPAQLAKALMIARLNSFLQGFSGVHTDVVNLLTTLINRNITPCIYEHGGVGASGDLVQLAHLGLMLIGEGEVEFEGKMYPAAELFRQQGIQPLTIRLREGLAILNGTSAMTGIGLINVIQAQKLLVWQVLLSALTNEVVEAYNDHFSHELNRVKLHPGQQRIAAMMQEALHDSDMIRDRSEHLYNPDKLDKEVFEDKVQEYYSLRCVTQILGPVYDTIVRTREVLVNELNSANDNPVVDVENQHVYHGGNFHGDYVSLEMDKLKIAITRLSQLSERQLNYLLNQRLNGKFPPFLNLGVLGLNFGMQGVQFTAVSTVAENQTLAFPMYVHTIPNNNDNQDIVSMGCNAALMTYKVVQNSFEVLTIQLMTLLQAVDYLQCQSRLSGISKILYQEVRNITPKFIEDEPRYTDLQRVRTYLETAEPALKF